MKDYTAYVNIKQGTFSEPRFSCGNTLPLVAAPFGMNHFCLQTKGADDGWYYHPTHRQTEGIRLTHQASPWVRDYGHFVFMPQSGDPYVRDYQRTSGFTELVMAPGHMELYFKRYMARINLAASDRCAVAEIAWDTNQTPRFALLPFDFHTELTLDPATGVLSGWTNAWGDGTRKDFRMYFHMEFDQPMDAKKTVITDNSGKTGQGLSGSGVGINIAFDIPRGETLTVRMGTSFISAEQACENVRREVGQLTYAELKAQTAGKWNELLSKIEITDTEERKKTFYSCLHRCFLYPRMFYEYDKDGNIIHYSTKDGQIRPGFMYTDNGFWDTCRTLYPLFSLLIPERLKEMLQGYLNFYQEEGWLPKWLAPGERGIMPGTLIDAVLADAAVKGLLTEEQMELALEGMLKHANIPSGNHLNGRVGVAAYAEKGYVPMDQHGESVNNALDAYYCDYCISQVAALLGKKELQQEYKRRAQNYKLLFDEEVGFIRGLNADGTRKPGFVPHEWADEYCEGSAWQNAFGVYHDIDGLAALYGGKEAFAAKLDQLFAAPPIFEVGKYHAEIHEMTEMQALGEKGFGQCGLSNQPSFHIPYLFTALGQPEKTAYWVGRLVGKVFDSAEKGFPGDEDNGSMSAWYVLSVLGFYPVCPGKAEYVTGVCNAQEIRLTIGNGNEVLIHGKGCHAVVDGAACANGILTHRQLMKAKEILFLD